MAIAVAYLLVPQEGITQTTKKFGQSFIVIGVGVGVVIVIVVVTAAAVPVLFIIDIVDMQLSILKGDISSFNTQ